ncbi:MAG TPA: tRNA (adenosine(37)-N6)-dimethylallyltransferase MiaA [Pyrinomonadaceae bacterium]|nr:tRNA (adenosine(37)-N6)-dimethylallyltransferase MiaA [Pyrinomonadaceae bacterium]
MPTPTDKMPIFAIAGPTASGKTALAVFLAEKLGAEVVNFDSVQIYRRIKIATAKPTAAEMRGIPHHLIDYVDPNIDYTAADWAKDAEEKIHEIESRNKRVILVGGTGFYLRSLCRPLFESPKTDPELREKYRRLHAEHGPEYLHAMLATFDPQAAENLPVRDHVRVIRALEVIEQTGERISVLQPERPEPPAFAERISLIVLSPPRDVLYEKINARTREHFDAGLVDEVKGLLADGVRENGNALGAHAYRRVCEYLRGDRSLENAIERSQQDVRNYAKRQLTWFRKESSAVWFEGFGGDNEVEAKVLEYVNHFA